MISKDDGGRSSARYFYDAIGEEGEGAVLVFESCGQHDVSIARAKFSRLHNHRLAGLVTDVRIRGLRKSRGI